MTFIDDDITTLEILEDCARHKGDRLFATSDGVELTIAELHFQSHRYASLLSSAGVQRGDRVAVMLDNHLDYVILFFALMRVGTVHVPINTRLRHDSLAYLTSHCTPRMIITEAYYFEHLQQAGCFEKNDITIVRDPVRGFDWPADCEPENIPNSTLTTTDVKSTDSIVFIMYTSGTTGPPKGVMVTDKMLRASSHAAALSADARPGDRFPVWEPLYHIGATQLLPLALEKAVTLHFIGHFSASGFWQCLREIKATHLHFLGGILQILLRQPPNEQDRNHSCRVAWGGGAPVGIIREFESRFGVEVRENYGMTEASSLTSINTDGHKGSVGKPAPWFDVMIVDENNHELASEISGEIVVRGRETGLITPGYYRNELATIEAIRDGWLHSGDLGYLDQEGYLYYAGRLKESIRRRGENISAWEIERVVERMEIVEQTAAIGVPDELGDEEIKLFIKLTDSAKPEQAALLVHNWCREHLADFQVPRYISIIEGFPLTGTQRIRKELLSRSTDPATETLFIGD